MSLVWLQVGQCGNQVGQEWWRMLSCNASDEGSNYPYFSRGGSVNAICVDSEAKVIRTMRRQLKKSSFRDSSLIAGRTGRGNNWAYGYSGSGATAERNLLDQTMESLRKEVERRDCYSGTVLLHSLCGGTGSAEAVLLYGDFTALEQGPNRHRMFGQFARIWRIACSLDSRMVRKGLGARLCEEIRQTYPAGHILSVAVAPHQSGETPLQHYNSLLCLAWLQRFADGVLIFQNDDVMCQAAALTDKKSPAVSGTPTAVSLSAMNSHIASCLAGLLYPVYSLKTSSSVSVGPEPWELLRSLCPMSSLKFLHTAQVCQRGTAFWDRVTSSLVQTLPRASPEGRMHHSLSVLAAARCSQDDSFLVSRDSVLNKLKQAYRCVAWNPRPVHCWIDSQNIVDPTCHSLSLTVCANHSSAADLISRVSQRAQAMYTARAYLHWYQRYGCEDEDFELAFQTLDEVVEEYSRLGDL